MGKKLTRQEFIERSIVTHGYTYDYSRVDYINSRTKVLIVCPEYGEFWQEPRSHMKGSGHPEGKASKISKSKAQTEEEFVLKAKALYKEEYDYTSIHYKGNRVKVTILCNKCNTSFEQTPNSHLSGKGCPTCSLTKGGMKHRNSKQSVIDSFKTVHGDNYDYSKVDYITTNTHVSLKCNRCSLEFRQTPHNHIAGNGCPKCSNEHKGWTHTKWENRGDASVHFDSFKLYIIRCYNETEEFYKIGKTFNSVNVRFSGGKLPYNYDVTHIRTGTAKHISILEYRVHRLLRSRRYTPILSFKGDTECFL